MQLTKNFTLEEMMSSSVASRKRIENRPSEPHINNLKKLCETILQPVRDCFGGPIVVTSGYRNERLNSEVGGASTSQHLKGEAADITSSDNKGLWKLIREMIENREITVGQLIDEKNLSWIHISLPTSNHLNQILSIK